MLAADIAAESLGGKMDYLKLLEHSYKKTKDCLGDNQMDKLEYLADHIFGFTTYENIVSSMMAQKCLEVCVVISNKKTFEYIKTEEGNLWYLIMVNMPFFQDKLEWGTSIRGAWWNLYGNRKFSINTCGLFQGDEQMDEIVFGEEQWPIFIEAMIQFAKKEIS